MEEKEEKEEEEKGEVQKKKKLVETAQRKDRVSLYGGDGGGHREKDKGIRKSGCFSFCLWHRTGCVSQKDCRKGGR